MSYILDALKRAEAERHGGAPQRPDLPAAFVAAPAPRPEQRTRHWLIGTGAALLLAALAFALLGIRPEPAPTALTPVAALEAAPPAESSPPASAPAPAEPPAAVIIPPNAAAAPLPPPPVAQKRNEGPAREERAQIGTLRDLPEHLQREIPPLVIGGYLYSPNPADRSVLINSRLRREGDEVAPGLNLEALQPDGMVLNYRGHRYRSRY